MIKALFNLLILFLLLSSTTNGYCLRLAALRRPVVVAFGSFFPVYLLWYWF